jgi:hypothetical protein
MKALQSAFQRLRTWWRRWLQDLQILGLWPASPKEMKGLEETIQDSISLVKPKAGFREKLRENLSLAAERKISGIVVEYPKPFRGEIIIGISAGLLAATVATLLLVHRARPHSARGGS